jgi:hypothetical protein
VDISHRAQPYNLQQAAYLLLSAYPYFPAGTIHIIMTDVFFGHAPRMILAQRNNSYFIAPDNGILPLTFGHEPELPRLCHEFEKTFSFNSWVDKAARAAELISKGNFENAFPICGLGTLPRLLKPNFLPDGAECNILYIDRYENVVLDITRKQFDEVIGDKPFKIKISRLLEISEISNNYADAPKGEPLCRFNSTGFLEIAFNQEKAATQMGLWAFNTGNLIYQTIRISIHQPAQKGNPVQKFSF